jgi:two-component system LytT family response regulator
MQRIRVLLVDDEPLANAGLRALLASHRDLEIVGEALSGAEAIQKILTLSPDLVFLDVQMPKCDGFEVLRSVLRRGRVDAKPFRVIFVTAYDEFAVRAFEVRALDYLLKPVDEGRFQEAVARARDALRTVSSAPAADALELRLRALLDDFTAARTGRASDRHLRRILVGIGPRTVPVEVGDIDWIGARDYCAELHAGGKTYVVRETLSALEGKLDPAIFARIHRSAIVNLSRVTELRKRTVRGASVVLTDGSRLPVSRNRRARLVELLGSRDWRIQ